MWVVGVFFLGVKSVFSSGMRVVFIVMRIVSVMMIC